jgi:hypothetical protein
LIFAEYEDWLSPYDVLGVRFGRRAHRGRPVAFWARQMLSASVGGRAGPGISTDCLVIAVGGARLFRSRRDVLRS